MLHEFSQNMIFQQDGGPPHYTRAVKRLSDAERPNSWSGRGDPKTAQLTLQISCHVTFSHADILMTDCASLLS